MSCSPNKIFTLVIKDELKKVKEYIENLVTSILSKHIFKYLLSYAIYAAIKLNRVKYAEELQSISEIVDIDISHLLIMQIFYELNSCCTSVVVNSKDGYPYHLRTMDWEMNILKSITINLDVYKDKKKIYSATTWVGYVGIFTAVNSKWSVSLNYRRTNESSLLMNVYKLIKGYWPNGYLIREVMESNCKLEVAKNIFRNSSLISPCYFIICGKYINEGYIIRRGANTKCLNDISLKEKGFIIQTNIDDINTKEDIMMSKQRLKLLNENIHEGIEVDDLCHLFNQYPITNYSTIYTSLMIPKLNILQTKISK